MVGYANIMQGIVTLYIVDINFTFELRYISARSGKFVTTFQHTLPQFLSCSESAISIEKNLTKNVSFENMAKAK